MFPILKLIFYHSGDSDYIPCIHNATFQAGETSKVVYISITPDSLVEEDEIFWVKLKALPDQPLTMSLSDSAQGIIIDDDSKEIKHTFKCSLLYIDTTYYPIMFI